MLTASPELKRLFNALLCLALFVSLLASAFTQSSEPYSSVQPKPAPNSEKDIQDLLSQIQSRLIKSNIIDGSFSQERKLAGFSYSLKSQGSFIFWEKNGFYWEITQPFYRATTFRKDRTIIWSSPDEIAHESKPSIIQKHINKILVALLSGKISHLEKQFSIEESQVQDDNWSLTLHPKQSAIEKQIQSISLTGNTHIKNLSVIGKGNDSTEISFTSPNANEHASSEQCNKFYPNNNAHCNLKR
ncbi:MAG: outer membrane lipoprotein carrier protein LolA [Agarilytica sp.]